MALVYSVVYVGLLGLFSYYVGEALPREWFHEDSVLFRSRRWEKDGAVYDKLNIKKWKLKLLDMSKIMKHSKLPKQISGAVTSGDITALIKETCVAETTHLFLCVFSCRVYSFWNNWIGVLIAIACIVGNLPFIMIQRYNRPNLQHLRDKLLKREQRLQQRRADDERGDTFE